jgi:2-polyprenyl-3-methyl-5-hydroxy-6-metoxy-1,4-benzoquinol methylase/uncharacterized protein YbaR (Trm112 family)
MSLSNNGVVQTYGSQSTVIESDFFFCSYCQLPLKAGERIIWCSSCNRHWPIKDGIPHFGGTDARPSALTQAERNLVVDAAAKYGWEVALHDRLRNINPTVYRQASDEYRAQWRFLLPLSPSSYVMDLSCGWGSVTFNLAEICELVVAADASSDLTRFVTLRSRQKRQHNIIALQLGLNQPLPFRKNSFDVVVLCDALNWIAGPGIQRTLLRRIKNVLKPGGSLLLAETNRLSALRMVTRSPSSNLHSASGYKRMLQSVGFRDFRVYALAPSHLEPFFIIPLEQRSPLSYLLREIVSALDFGVHFQQRGLGMFYD